MTPEQWLAAWTSSADAHCRKCAALMSRFTAYSITVVVSGLRTEDEYWALRGAVEHARLAKRAQQHVRDAVDRIIERVEFRERFKSEP